MRSIVGLDSKDCFDRENEARKMLSQILGGLVLLIGFYFTWQNLGATQENLTIASEGQTTDRFTEAIAQLGEPDDTKLAVRLGGIYALARMANDPKTDLHWPIMEILTAHVREHSKIANAAKSSLHALSTKNAVGGMVSDKPQEEQLKPAADIQAILTLIGQHTMTTKLSASWAFLLL